MSLESWKNVVYLRENEAVSLSSHDTMLVWYVPASCVCVCVLLSCHTPVLCQWLNLGSHKDSSFLLPKITAKFERGHPQQAPNVGGVKSVTLDK